MSIRTRTSHQPMKPPRHHRLWNHRMEMQGKRQSAESDKAATTSGRTSIRERRLALMQDVDRLKKKLRHEENIHRALERAFNRPLGALPRLPPYLPQNTQELLAEIAVLEEEVVRLEEQVVNYRQGLYQEAIYICSKTRLENPVDSCKLLSNKTSKHERFRWRKDVDLASLLDSSSHKKPGVAGEPQLSKANTGVNLPVLLGKSPRVPAKMAQVSLDYISNETDSSIDKHDMEEMDLKRISSPKKKPYKVKQPSVKQESARNSVDSPRLISNQERAQETISCSLDSTVIGVDSEPNKVSEDLLKCLCSIFVRLSTDNDQPPQVLVFSSSIVPQKCEARLEFQDPYGSNVAFKDRDIGSYQKIYAMDAGSIDVKRKRNVMFLLHKLKILLGKLASVSLEGLSHQHKLAFWINTYNSCMLNAFLEHGIPECPEMIVGLMGEATIVIGGQLLNAITIEHFILRLPFYLKYVCPKAVAKNDESKARSMFGLEWCEPLVTFGLSCGSWSSPAVRVYTASNVESELEAAKRDYLQAAVGVSQDQKLIIPKLLDWYMLDFAKDLDSLLDWVCLQLPDQPRKAALRCVETRGEKPVSKIVQVIPYDFSFRYLISP